MLMHSLGIILVILGDYMKTRKELRDELYNLRLKLELIKKERIENDIRVQEIESKISVVRKRIAQELIDNKENIEHGKKL